MPDRPDRRPVVAIVSDAIYPYNKGGKELRYHEITSRLADAGWDVNVYTMHWWDGPRERVENGITYRALCRRQGLYSGGRRSIFQAFAFSLGFELIVSIRAGNMVSIQNTRCRENILQAQSKST